MARRRRIYRRGRTSARAAANFFPLILNLLKDAERVAPPTDFRSS